MTKIPRENENWNNGNDNENNKKNGKNRLKKDFFSPAKIKGWP